jgi:hypothetical protein
LTPAQERRVIEEDLVSSRTKTLTTVLPGRGGAGNAIVQEAKKELDIGAPSGNQVAAVACSWVAVSRVVGD